MEVSGLKRIKFERYVFSAVAVFIMFFIAQISGQKEIIFPEILAIMTGAWISDFQPWNVNKRRIFILVSLSSIIGVAIVKYLAVPLFFQVLVCFVLVGLSLILAKTNFIPIISACILPIYMQTDTWIYSFSVTFMAFLIILIQWLMEKYRLKPQNHYIKSKFDTKEEVKRWIKLFFIFGIIAIIPLESRNIFFLAPPLIVTFTEFANPDSSLRKNALKVWMLVVSAACIGSFMKMLLTLYLHLPLVITVVFACVLLFIIFDYIHIQFPPAGAILLLPMILSPNDLKYFPFEVLVGASILIPLSIFLFKKKEK